MLTVTTTDFFPSLHHTWYALLMKHPFGAVRACHPMKWRVWRSACLPTGLWCLWNKLYQCHFHTTSHKIAFGKIWRHSWHVHTSYAPSSCSRSASYTEATRIQWPHLISNPSMWLSHTSYSLTVLGHVQAMYTSIAHYVYACSFVQCKLQPRKKQVTICELLFPKQCDFPILHIH